MIAAEAMSARPDRHRSGRTAIDEAAAWDAVLRRDREQTLGLILERSLDALGGLGGTLHLIRPPAPDYVMAQAVNVVQLDWLAVLPADDLLLCRALAAKGPVLLPITEVAARWRALVPGNGHALVGVALGRRVKTASDFFVARRQLGPGLIFSTMLAANIGAGSTVGATSVGYSEGIAAWWWAGSAAIGSEPRRAPPTATCRSSWRTGRMTRSSICRGPSSRATR